MPRSSSSPKFFQYVLRERISSDDSEWAFQVPRLPTPESANNAALIKLVSLSTRDSHHRMELRYDPVEENRAIKGLPLDRYLLVSVSEFRSMRTSVPSTEGSASQVVQPTTPRECSEYIVKLLRTGIVIQGVHYNFYGHSNSQLKSRTCYLCAGPKEQIAARVESLGDFTKMKTVAKKAKRIGLLFSTAQAAAKVDPKRVEDIPDIEVGDYAFTDGCGLISPGFARDLAGRVRAVFRNRRYTPSVFQIRYRGYKGVVTLDPTMKKGGPWLQMRKSMKKFSGGDDLTFSVVEYSRPYMSGNLNDEVIVLLEALGIDRATLLRKQGEHFEFLANALQDPQSAFRFLCYLNRPDLAERVIVDSLDAVRPTINKLINAEYDKMLNKREEQKCRILIPKSRLLFGVCDAWGVLKEGQCAVKVTMDGDGLPYALKGMKVLVTRNPCLHPGDIQKLDVVERPELAHLVDCVVFPTTGRRPAADTMSGGDLDGDTFFVTWDTDIIPSTVSQAANYPGVREPLRFTPITDDDRLVYFAKYTNASLGRVKNLYLKWAKANGAMRPECQELSRLFSQCVDGNRIQEKQLAKFVNPPDPEPGVPPFILDELHEAATSTIAAQKASRKVNLEGYSFDGLELLLCMDDVAMSEMELIGLTVRWCRRTGTSFGDLVHLFDFNALAPEDKSWALSQIPPSIRAPSLVLNALCSSSLVTESEVHHFHLDYPGMHWKRVYSSEQDRLATFLHAAGRNLEMFHKKLLVFRPNDRLTLAIYVPQKITSADDQVVDDKVRMFAFPHSQGRETQSRLSLPTKKDYRLFCDGNTLQLFQGKRGNTWVYIGRGGSDDSSYRNLTKTQDRRKARQETLESGTNFDFRASVALDKFGKGLQGHVGRLQRQGISAAEIYVITNRDVSSMRTLDLWESHIGTDQTLPLFETTPKQYDVPKLRDIDWEAQDRLVVEVACRGNLTALQDVIDPGNFGRLFMWLLANEQRGLIIRCFEHLVDSILSNQIMAPEGAVHAMTGFAPRIPYASVTFANLSPWSDLPDELRVAVHNRSASILRCIILSESEYGELVVSPFQKILENIEWLSLPSFSDMVETIALTVHSAETALDLLLDCLDRQSARFLTGRPAIIQHFVRNMIAVAAEHIGEVQEETQTREELLQLRPDDVQDSDDRGTRVEVSFRIDATGGSPMANAHVRLIAASPPTSSVLEKTYSMDGLVLESRPGIAKILFFHLLPSYYMDCSWKLQDCGLFVTTKTMLDAIARLGELQGDCCGVIDQIIGLQPAPSQSPSLAKGSTYTADRSLNMSQRAAVDAAQGNKFTCLWGPPGTGKTQTIVAIIRRLQSDPDSRILVSAPTHNAVDNVMRRYLGRISEDGVSKAPELAPLRVSTEVRKVAEDLRKHTCDALAGAEVHSSQGALRQAKRRVAGARIVFTTCIGAGIGLLREQAFDTVVVDEASQQTEPASLVPLVKGCARAVLVGDHVQLRPTVRSVALALGLDVSLFERLYTRPAGTAGMARVMLDTQYRMHPSMCEFVSREFYQGKLLSGVRDQDRPLPASSFPWPALLQSSASKDGSTGLSKAPRTVFVECAEREDLGHKSKLNKAQADLCLTICKLLRTPPVPTSTNKQHGPSHPDPTAEQLALPSLAVLTPYSRQAQHLKRLLAGITNVEVSSIDGFQGREADVVVFVTVRCNESREIGFLKDIRRMNVALTRARLGLVIVGNRLTLTGGREEEESTGMWRGLLDAVSVVSIDESTEGR